MAAAFDIVQYPAGVRFTQDLEDIILFRKKTEYTSVMMWVILAGTIYSGDICLYYDKEGSIRIKTKDLAKGLIRYSSPAHAELLPFPSLEVHLMDEFEAEETIAIPLIEGSIPPYADARGEWLGQNFLTWQPQIITMPRWQPQWLTIAKSSNHPAALRIKTRLYTAEGTEFTKEICTISEQGLTRVNAAYWWLWQRLDEMAITPIAYDIYGIGMDDPSAPDEDGVVNYPFAQRYVLRSEYILDRCFMHQNSLGGFDTVMATGVRTYVPTGDARTFVNDGEESEIGGAYISFWEQNTGYISSDRIARQWQEFLNSTNRFLFDRANNTWQKIVVDEFEVKEKSLSLTAYTFKYHLARQNEGAFYIREELMPHPLPTKYFNDEG